MELRRLSLYLALFVLAVCSQCSDAHSMRRRGTEDGDYDDALMGDEATDDEAQNDADGGNDADEDTPPETIITQPTSYNVTVGRTIRLECKVSPNNSPVIQWYKNGQPLFMGKNTFPYLKQIDDYERLSFDPTTSNDLLISDVRPSDNGMYRCQVMQQQPAVIDHLVAVQEAPRVIKFHASDNGVVMEGSDLVLTCDVAGSPPPQIVWSRDINNVNVRLTEKDAAFTLNTATLRGIKRKQSGKYYCYAFNSLGQAQAEQTIKVLHKPHVQIHKNVVNSALEVPAVLQCSAHGEPAPTITWYKDGDMVDATSDQFVITYDGPHSNLTVTPHEDTDFGTFTCEARNSHGKHSNNVELVQRPVVEDVNIEGNKLSWTVVSHQPLEQMELQLRDTEGTVTTLSVPVPETKGHNYYVAHILDNINSGKYEVVVKARNNKEWSRESEPVVVDYESNMPMPIQTASVYHGNSHSIRPASSVVLSTIFMYLLVRMF